VAQFDVIIAGGAMAGATLALALDRLSGGKLSIAVVEAFLHQNDDHPGFDARSIALSYGTQQILERLDLWSAIQTVATPIKHINISDQHHVGLTEVSAQEAHIDALGYVVELQDVGGVLHHAICNSKAITLCCPAVINEVQRTADAVMVTLADGAQLNAKLLVAADGAMSTCCEKIGLDLSEHDFKQVALIANIQVQSAHNGRAFERFTPQGPLALLPMRHHRMSLVWCVDQDQADSLLALPDVEFIERLQHQFGWRLGKIEKCSNRSRYPLILRHHQQNISHRFAVVGNAAQTLHPIAGQGFNLGIRDVISLAEIITQSASDIGDYALLNQFRQNRQNDRSSTIWLTSSLVSLFSNTWLSTSLGRNLGLIAMDNIPSIKAPLLRHTLGIVNR
jgi:2-octaprenyl-6-methoxyphenol hydroxylase